MEKTGIIFKKPIFIKLLITFVIIIIAVFMLGISIYNQGTVTLQKELSYSVASHAQFYMENLESEIQRIKNQQYNLMNDDNLYKLSSLSDFISHIDKTEAMFRLQQRLSAIKDSSAYIKNIFVMIPAINKTIQTEQGTSDISYDQYENLQIVPELSNAQIIYWDHRMFLSSAYPINYSNDGKKEPKYIIGIELSRTAFENALKQFESYAESGAVLVTSIPEYTFKSRSNNKAAAQILDSIKNQPASKTNGTGIAKINGKTYMEVYVTSEYLQMTLLRYMQEDIVFAPLKKYQILFVVFLIDTLFLVIIYYFSTYKLIHKPLNKLIQSFQKIEQGELDFVIEHKKNDEFGYLYKRFNIMIENFKSLISQVYKQKILAQKAELKHLQSQINPHFLYNSFFNLYNMVENEDYDNAKYFTKQMGNYFQYITRSASDEVPLIKEVTHARIYAEIQAKRFRNRICLVFEPLPERYNNLIVPRLIIQPIIENAFEHGLENKSKDGSISVKFNIIDKYLCICIEDNGIGMSEEELNKLGYMLTADGEIESTGMINIHRRINFKCGAESGLKISKGESGGLKVYINIALGEEHLSV